MKNEILSIIAFLACAGAAPFALRFLTGRRKLWLLRTAADRAAIARASERRRRRALGYHAYCRAMDERIARAERICPRQALATA